LGWEPGREPEPPQVAHLTRFGTRISLSVPSTASSRVNSRL